eukprot:s1682_g8.t1
MFHCAFHLSSIDPDLSKVVDLNDAAAAASFIQDDRTDASADDLPFTRATTSAMGASGGFGQIDEEADVGGEVELESDGIWWG